MSVLSALDDEGFDVRLGPIVPSPALRRRLAATPEVRAVTDALARQLLTDADVESFVESLIDDFRRGVRSVHSLALAALAVALETRPGDLAENYIARLSSLPLSEIHIATGVARECANARRFVALTRVEHVQLGPPAHVSGVLIATPLRLTSAPDVLRVDLAEAHAAA